MAESIRVANILIVDEDGIGPVRCHIDVEILTDVSPDAAAAGAGRHTRNFRGKLSRAKWVNLLGNINRVKGDKLSGNLEAILAALIPEET